MSPEVATYLIVSLVAAGAWASKIAYDVGRIRQALETKLEHTALRMDRVETICSDHESRLQELEALQ